MAVAPFCAARAPSTTKSLNIGPCLRVVRVRSKRRTQGGPSLLKLSHGHERIAQIVVHGGIPRGDLCRALPALNRTRPIAGAPIGKARPVQLPCIILRPYPLALNPKQRLHVDT
jgi:hypothetical protein